VLCQAKPHHLAGRTDRDGHGAAPPGSPVPRRQVGLGPDVSSPYSTACRQLQCSVLFMYPGWSPLCWRRALAVILGLAGGHSPAGQSTLTRLFSPSSCLRKLLAVQSSPGSAHLTSNEADALVEICCPTADHARPR